MANDMRSMQDMFNGTPLDSGFVSIDEYHHIRKQRDELLAALESWSFSQGQRLADYLYEKIENAMESLEREVLPENITQPTYARKQSS